ncbi:YgfZ/GcvT domain-containing protein [Corynebacterium sp. L4756]|uniref:CAF17-like 4Fe-4S cluster assembly/insertion protein YgfZ n=2 Tax=unclassified Corynebacterium TaxID=2624378 RepID=UPI00374CD6B7
MSYTSPLMQLPGAAVVQDTTLIDSQGVAWHYGDPLVEQRAIHFDTPVLVDRSQRRVISVTGPDAPEFLNNLLSQKLDDVNAGYTATALDLDIQGRILHHADVVRTEEGFFLDTTEAEFSTFLDFLTKMIFWSQVEVKEADLALLTLLGPIPELPTEVTSEAAFVRDVPAWTKTPRTDIAIPRDQLATLARTLIDAGLKPAGLMAFTAERIRNLEPERAADLDDKSIPHEVWHWIGRGELPGAVHLEKGCYRGQETIARVENLGRSPRLLVLLYLDGSAPEMPEIGAEITSGGRKVGRMGTIIDDFEYGPIALGLVKRSALPATEDADAAATELLIGDVAATIDVDSLPRDEGIKLGRNAIDKLRGK